MRRPPRGQQVQISPAWQRKSWFKRIEEATFSNESFALIRVLILERRRLPDAELTADGTAADFGADTRDDLASERHVAGRVPGDPSTISRVFRE
jgi:hypothetical protein